jgi:hypothetical protein
LIGCWVRLTVMKREKWIDSNDGLGSYTPWERSYCTVESCGVGLLVLPRASVTMHIE